MSSLDRSVHQTAQVTVPSEEEVRTINGIIWKKKKASSTTNVYLPIIISSLSWSTLPLSVSEKLRLIDMIEVR